MVSLWTYTNLFEDVEDDYDSFVRATNQVEDMYERNELTLSECLGRWAGLLHDKAGVRFADSDRIQRAQYVRKKFLEFAADKPMERCAECWFVVELLSYIERP